MEQWLFGQSNSSVVAGWSFLITIIGFGLTFWQLWKTRSAASAAETAAKEAKTQALAFDAAFEIARLTSSLRESLRHIADDGWVHAVDSLTEAQVAIVKLHDLHEGFAPHEKVSLNEMGDQLSQLQTKITRSQSKGVQSLSKPKAIEILSGYHIRATRLSTRFEKVVK